jgi:hypothetical protein
MFYGRHLIDELNRLMEVRKCRGQGIFGRLDLFEYLSADRPRQEFEKIDIQGIRLGQRAESKDVREHDHTRIS